MKVIVTALTAERFGARVREVAPNVETVVLYDDGSWQGEPAEADAAFLSAEIYRTGALVRIAAQLPKLRRLRWLHTYSIGVDHPAYQAVIDRGITLTNGAGSQSLPIAQHVLLMMLRHVKNLAALEQAQARREWADLPGDELTGKTVALLGLGGVGAEVARLAKAFDMRVIGMRRGPEPVDNVDEMLPPGAIGELCARADFLVVCAPLTRATRGMIGAAELARMKSSAYLINIARGALVDESALIDALRSGRIAGAALDVFETEPLPPEHPLWTMPNVIVTPHCAPASSLHVVRTTDLFIENLRRYTTGRPLLNVVDPEDVGAG